MCWKRWHPRSRQFDAQQVENALYGLQNKSSDVREVVDVLVAMTPKIEGCG
jgi:hypothetical protein